ncbi:MAG: hypothetical protein ACLSCV_10910 [Acutalibacteraceae bacterium]
MEVCTGNLYIERATTADITSMNMNIQLWLPDGMVTIDDMP